MPTVRCPTCSQQFDPQKSRSMPFCSDRCRQIDLRRWLNEDISIPFREAGDDEGPALSDDRNRYADEDND
jgi:endogenous inhibitor of DNA gyrase (YacG/DUF329 family)